MANVGEKGITFRIGTAFNMAANTSLSLDFFKPDGTVLTVVPTLETIEQLTDKGTFLANESVKYVLAAGDLSVDGTWAVQLTFNDTVAGLILKTRKANFFVGA